MVDYLEKMIEGMDKIQDRVMIGIDKIQEQIDEVFKKHNKMMADLIKSERMLTNYTRIMICCTVILIIVAIIQMIRG